MNKNAETAKQKLAKLVADLSEEDARKLIEDLAQGQRVVTLPK